MMPAFSFKVFAHLKKRKGYCDSCKKTRTVYLDFFSPETPHLSQEYASWLEKLCEIYAVFRAGELADIDKMTMYRLDFVRLKRIFQYYEIS